MTAACSIAGCDRTGRLRRGWCEMHYARWYRHGDPLISLTSRELVHGTHDGYQNHKCRCDSCRQAFAQYIRERNWRLGWHRPHAVVAAERRERLTAVRS